MIAVKIKLPLYIRQGSGTAYSTIGVAPASGETIIMDGVKLDGDVWKGITKWYYKINEKSEKQWYWGGRIEEVPTIESESDTKDFQTWMLNLRLPEIWQHTTGRNVGVAIIDTGIVLNNSQIPFSLNVFNTYQNRNDINDLRDVVGHGTECASIVGARNTNGFYIGVAPNSSLFAYKIADVANQQNTDEQFNRQLGLKIADAIDWCSKQKNIKVISISWTVFLDEENVEDKVVINKIQTSINNAHTTSKSIILAARGNTRDSNDISKFYPACLENIISVGLIPDGNLFNFSGFIDITTFGLEISAYSLDSIPITTTGTSMSTAIIAGIVCLILEKKGLQYDINAMKTQLKNLSQISTDNISKLNGNLLYNFLST